MAENLGLIVHNLSTFNLHLKHREEFLNFFKMMVSHKDPKMRRHAAYNLPCFYKLLKEYQDEVDLDFNEVYLKLSKDEDPEIVRIVASSLHEAFFLMPDDEDSQKLRDAFKQVIEANNKETIIAVSENLDVSLLHYCNSHAVKMYAH
jgi:mannose/fructose-specific phosphotransferase system component IIA